MSFDNIANINGVEIFLSTQFSQRKKTAIKWILSIQLNGMHNVYVPNMKFKKIYIEPYVETSKVGSDIVPGSYEFDNIEQRLYIREKYTSLKITTDSVSWGIKSIFGFSIHFIYYLCVILSGKALVHAAGLKYKNKNILIPAFGGIGKTFLVTKFSINPDVQVYGDDLILVDESANIYPYLRPMCIYKYHYDKYLKNRLRQKFYYMWPSLLFRIILRARMELVDRYGLKLNLFNRIAHRKGYITTEVTSIISESQVPKAGGNIDHIILIKRLNVKNISVQRIESKDALKRCYIYASSVIQHEWSEYHKMLLTYTAFSCIDILNSVKDSEYVINNAFSMAKYVHVINIPLNANDSDIESAVLSIV